MPLRPPKPRFLAVSALVLGLVLIALGASRGAAQMTTVAPGYPTPLPMPTPIQLQGVQLIVAPAFALGAAGTLSRYERKQLVPYLPVTGNEAAIGAVTAAEEYARTAVLYARRTAESRALEARHTRRLAVPLRHAR